MAARQLKSNLYQRSQVVQLCNLALRLWVYTQRSEQLLRKCDERQKGLKSLTQTSHTANLFFKPFLLLDNAQSFYFMYVPQYTVFTVELFSLAFPGEENSRKYFVSVIIKLFSGLRSFKSCFLILLVAILLVLTQDSLSASFGSNGL